MNMNAFTIDRSKWIRGYDASPYPTSLLNPAGHMCCLGFCLRAYGLEEADIKGKPTPEDVENDRKSLPEEAAWLLQARNNVLCGSTGRDSSVTQDLIVINDSKDFGDAEREARLTKLFAKQGIEVTFVDGEVTG